MIQIHELENQIKKLEEQALLFEEEVEHWTQWQPQLASYILSDDFSLLSETEREILLFGSTVLFSLASQKDKAANPISEDVIGELDEANWTWIEEAEGRHLSEKMDGWFTSYPEPELLAFIEDLCLDEEQEDISPSGGEMMVVALKTVADALFLEVSSSTMKKV